MRRLNIKGGGHWDVGRCDNRELGYSSSVGVQGIN